MDVTRKILNGTLRPYLPDNRGDDYYEPEYNRIQLPLEKFIPHYQIVFQVPQFTYRIKYYVKEIDAAVITDLNTLFLEYSNASDARVAFELMQLRRTTVSRAQEIHRLITQSRYSIEELSCPKANYKDDTQEKECVFIYNYLLQALIRIYLEFQHHFLKQITESKRRSYEDFYIMKLGTPAPKANCLVELGYNTQAPPKESCKKDFPRGKKGFWIKGNNRIIEANLTINLYDNLTKKEFISKETEFKQFKECFSGKTIKRKVTWIEDKDLLTYFIKQLYKTNYIGDEASRWVAACNCFTNRNGDAFDPTNLKDQKKPKKRNTEIDEIISDALSAATP